MTAHLGVVVAGTGFGCITHVRALRGAGFDVVGLVGRDAEKTAERARIFDIPNALTSFDDALALPNVAAVTIATPPHTHAPLALAAIAAGKHVICEKPFGRDTTEGRNVLAAAETAGIVHLLGTEFRWDPGQATLARAVAAGAVGEPRLATAILHVPMLADDSAKVPAWWADAGSGGGWLGAHGSQVIDQLRVTLGEFAGVSASLPLVADRPERRASRSEAQAERSARPAVMSAEDTFVIHFRMRSGCVGVLQSSAGDWGPPIIETRITGSRGTAWIDGVGSKVLVADATGTKVVPPGDDLPTDRPEPLPDGLLHTAYDRMIAHGMDLGPYTRLAAAFRELILGHPLPTGPRPATFADGVAGMAVLDAVRRAAAERTWVEVEG